MNQQEIEFLSKQLLDLIGVDNIKSLNHCTTRLRFVLNSHEGINKGAIKNLKGVLGVVENGGQFQVIIGADVTILCENILSKLSKSKKESLDFTESKQKINLSYIGGLVFPYVTGSLQSLIPIMAGAGLLKGLVLVLVSFGWLNENSGTYHVLAATGNATFYFLPILLGFAAANKLGANPFLGAVVGASLLEPNYTILLNNSMESISFLQIPIFIIDYAQSVIPILIAVVILYHLENFLKSKIVKSLQMFLIPFACLIIVVPLTIIIFGPFGSLLSSALAGLFQVIFGVSPILAGFVLGSCWFLLVIFGLHWAFVPIMLINLQVAGYDFIIPAISGSTIAQTAVALAFFIKAKVVEDKALGGSAFVTSLLAGVTEPIVYGIILKYKYMVVITFLFGGISGAITSFLKVKATFLTMPSLFGLPAFMEYNFVLFVIMAIIVMIVTAMVAFVFGFQDKVVKISKLSK